MSSLLPKLVTTKVPPVKMQGIKTKLIPFIASSIQWDGHGKWIEPFVGSGCVVFNIAPQKALLCDTNQHLIEFYQALQNGTITTSNLRKHLESEGEKLLLGGQSHYYEIRKRFNDTHNPLDLIFLNRSCFNGVMRFNGKGKFNVPFCKKPDRFRPALVTKIINQTDWVIKTMQGKDWEFKCQDWTQTLNAAKKPDFVYLDPPYIGRYADYYNQWNQQDADNLVDAIKNLPCGFAYSMWKSNKYRENEHLAQTFSNYPMATFSHFYHVGATENLRNAVEEALILSPGNLYQPV
jgi:DNA adenine methylase